MILTIMNAESGTFKSFLSRNSSLPRKNLEFISIFNEDGTTNSNCGEFSNMLRYDVRVALVKRLEELGLYRVWFSYFLMINISIYFDSNLWEKA